MFAIAIFVYFSFASPVFLTTDNLLNIVYQNATIAIPACAVTLVIIAGNFDLSVGAMFTFAGVLCAYAALHWGGWWCFPVAIVAGALMGLVNGVTVTKLRVNAFLATLATALAFGGLALAVSAGSQIIPDSSVFTFLGQNSLLGIQYPVFMVVIVAVVLQLVLSYTVFGSHIYGVGGNPRCRAHRRPPRRPCRRDHVRHHRCRLRDRGIARRFDDESGICHQHPG